MRYFDVLRRVCRDGALAAIFMALECSQIFAQSPVLAPSPTSVIPPIVLQGCDQKRKAKHASVFGTSNGISTMVTGNSRGEQTVGFDVSFVNTTAKVAKIVVIRIGETDFAKIGSFAPDVVIAWRIAAHPGDCYVKAVRFDDGSEWSAPSPVPSPSP